MEKGMQSTTIIAVMIVALLAGSIMVLADPGAPLNLNELSDETRDLSTLEDQTVNTDGGNVSELTMEGLSVTTWWQGFFGNISGTITLDDADNNTLYNWTTASPDGEIYATRASSVTWANVGCASDANVTTEMSTLDQSALAGDSINNTFTSNSHPGFSIGTSAIATNACNSSNTYVSDAAQTTDFYQVLLFESTADNFIYTAIIDQDTAGFDDGLHDFQMMVGENGSTTTSTAYYFYVELS